MPKTGSLNWVIFISFDDGIEWVFRSPTRGVYGFYSDETASKIVVSEASTLMYLKVYTSIPVPEVYSYSGSSDSDISVPYILQSKATDRSLGSYDWSQLPRVPGLQNYRPLLPLSDKDREKVMSQLGAIMSELSDRRFEKIGSIFNDGNGSYFVAECLSPSLTWQERDSLDLDRGPFDEEHDYFMSFISAFTSHAQELQLTPHTFFAPVPDMLDYKTSSGPITELLATPSPGGSAAPPSEFLTAAFRSCFSQRATKVAPELLHSNLWETSGRMWYFSQVVRLLSKNDYEHFRRLFELIYETNAEEAGSSKGILWLFHERVNWDENKRLLAELQEEAITAEELEEKDSLSLHITCSTLAYI
ncbi:Protein-glutamate O-methyltransferase SPCC1393.13 [Fusarium austroafricanum]|uniref:Protein-glutamate O-methyltransferase SPCC1393.13 n=1 Tax=Fusarium austroafricanum TaxID=2364996 RepID=A0A8H4JYS4_9HYPO|nr:Protein-glutamate O-methyltransferase SPCC1393.13 [Fusarium austroafricanum]